MIEVAMVEEILVTEDATIVMVGEMVDMADEMIAMVAETMIVMVGETAEGTITTIEETDTETGLHKHIRRLLCFIHFVLFFFVKQ